MESKMVHTVSKVNITEGAASVDVKVVEYAECPNCELGNKEVVKVVIEGKDPLLGVAIMVCTYCGHIRMSIGN